MKALTTIAFIGVCLASLTTALPTLLSNRFQHDGTFFPGGWMDLTDVKTSTSIDINPSTKIISFIKDAHTSIQASVYKLNDVDIYEALSERLSRGIYVQIVADYHQNHMENSMISQLARQGAHVRLYGSYDTKDKLHAKFSIFDGRVGAAGSNNWTKSS
eukprot:Ihof_evm1s21 gene=Ihof_evmTU1s21